MIYLSNMQMGLLVCLFVPVSITSLLNIWGHIATVPACSSGTFDQCVATQECHAADTGHDTPPHHSIQTQSRPVAVLSIDVGRHTGIHSYPFSCLGSDLTGESFPDLPHTPANTQLYDAVMVVVSQKLGKDVKQYYWNMYTVNGVICCW